MDGLEAAKHFLSAASAAIFQEERVT